MLHNGFFMDDIITHLKFFKFIVMTMIVFFGGDLHLSAQTVAITTKDLSTIALRAEVHYI